LACNSIHGCGYSINVIFSVKLEHAGQLKIMFVAVLFAFCALLQACAWDKALGMKHDGACWFAHSSARPIIRFHGTIFGGRSFTLFCSGLTWHKNLSLFNSIRDQSLFKNRSYDMPCKTIFYLFIWTQILLRISYTTITYFLLPNIRTRWVVIGPQLN